MRLLITMVVLAVLASLQSVAPALAAGTFSDDDGSIHEPSIEAIAAAGITRGCNPPVNDRFCPDAVVTRGQMAAFLSRALDLSPAAALLGVTPKSLDRPSSDRGQCRRWSASQVEERLEDSGILRRAL